MRSSGRTVRHGARGSRAPIGTAEFRAVADRILETGMRFLERGREWLGPEEEATWQWEWSGGNREAGDAAGDAARGDGAVGAPDLRGLGPRGYVRSDERVLEDVCDRLCMDPAVDASGLEVRCESGCVVLEGTVPSRRMKHRVEDIADSVFGVKEVWNRLRVAGNRAGGGRQSSIPGTGTAAGGSDVHQVPGQGGGDAAAPAAGGAETRIVAGTGPGASGPGEGGGKPPGESRGG